MFKNLYFSTIPSKEYKSMPKRILPGSYIIAQENLVGLINALTSDVDYHYTNK